MKNNPFAVASRAKGSLAILRRANMVRQRYSITPAKMNRSLHLFAEILAHFDCGASFPLTATILQRNRESIMPYLDRNIEFAIHGYTHIDYSQLEPSLLLIHLETAQKTFSRSGIEAIGFRSPYLRRSSSLNKAIQQAGFFYTSNQPILWKVLDESRFSSVNIAGYRRALEFYQPWDADRQLSVPRRFENLVEIPVSLPDDEILLDRLEGETKGLIKETWLRILSKTYQFGELFTIQLHPERIAPCLEGLSAVLARARQLKPQVWFARMDEIAEWWRARASMKVEVKNMEEGRWQVEFSGPNATTILARDVEITGDTRSWADGYRRVHFGDPRMNPATAFVVRSGNCWPFVGVSPNCPPALISFLREQGYIVQPDEQNRGYSIYLNRVHFVPEDERSLMAQIEATAGPLVRFGRWPNGARSAICVTGDIDAMTLWDYGSRFFGK